MWWLITTIMAACALLLWRRSSALQKRLSDFSVVTKQQIHQIKNDLTSVCISIEGLAMSTEHTLPVEQYNVLSSAIEYSNRLKRSVCELLELEAMQNQQPLSVRETKISLLEIIKHREFGRFVQPITESLLSKYGSQVVFTVDRVKFLQIIDSFTTAATEFGDCVSFVCEFNEDSNPFQAKLVTRFTLKQDKFEFLSSLSYQYVTKVCDAIGLATKITIQDDFVCWEISLPKLELEKHNEQILVVTHAEDCQISNLASAMGRVVQSVNGIEEALCAIQQNCYTTVIFDGSKELGQQLALAKIIRHDLNIPAKTVLVSPEKSVSSQLASEFGIDSVMNAEQLKNYRI